MMTEIQNTASIKMKLLKKSAPHIQSLCTYSKYIVTYLKPLLIILITAFYVSACGGGGSDKSTSTPVTPTENIAPTATAGIDQSVNEQTLVMLVGSGTDPDGSIVSYIWTQIAGQSVTLTNPNNASTSFDSPASTSTLTLIFQLTITDNEGAIATDNVVITVNPPLPAQTLIVTGENEGNNFAVSWNNVAADSYRVLFWDNDGNVYGPTTTSLSLSITAEMRRLGGSLVVEAYDALGNSVFSSPINVEAL